MSMTHKFILPSGVECEVTEFLGKHQSMLTRQDKTNLADKLNQVIKDVVVRIGTVKDKASLETIIDNILSCDKKKILVEARQFSLDFPKQFDFTYDYIDAAGKEAKLEMKLDLTDAFKVKPLPVQVQEYADVEREVETVLPSGKKVIWSMMDNKAETRSMKMKREDISSHTPIKLRKPRVQLETTAVALELDSMTIREIEALRKDIKEKEGQVDTEFRFEHPEYTTKPEAEKYVINDLVGSINFFFPSGAI